MQITHKFHEAFAVGIQYAEIIHPEVTKMVAAIERIVDGCAEDEYDFVNFPITFDIPENYFDLSPRAWEYHAQRLGINLVTHSPKADLKHADL